MIGELDTPLLFGTPVDLAAVDTLTERAVALLQHDILAGTLKPGQPLRIVQLSEHYGIGATPLREALSRLVARNLISAVGQKGFRVTTMSPADLTDITRVRVLVEIEALRHSMRYGKDDWEAAILASLHRLVRIIEREPQAVHDASPAFDHLHKAFHRALLEACGSERLLHLHDELYYQAFRYRHTMMRSISDPQILVASHTKLAELVIARKADEAEAELVDHLNSTIAIVYGEAGHQARVVEASRL